MGILSGNPKDEPMHYGEIYGVWQFSMGAKMNLSCLQAYQNHAGDKELKDILQEMIDKTRQIIKECDEVLTANNIAPAPGLPERPGVKLEEIPVGARFTDPEIAAAIAAENAAGLVLCSQIIGMSIREDIAAIFVKFHTEKVALGAKILRMSKNKGWLIPPPLQVQRPEPVHT